MNIIIDYYDVPYSTSLLISLNPCPQLFEKWICTLALYLQDGSYCCVVLFMRFEKSDSCNTTTEAFKKLDLVEHDINKPPYYILLNKHSFQLIIKRGFVYLRILLTYKIQLNLPSRTRCMCSCNRSSFLQTRLNLMHLFEKWVSLQFFVL